MIHVTVAFALPERQEVLALELPEGSTIADAIAAARIAERFPGLDMATLKTGIWSREASLATALRDTDRVEVYRPLAADPKETRRSRALKSSTRSRNEP
jgi:uncharacterized protein